MRAEGVLRLILNVSLYVGMSCLEDGKHVRTTVIEDGERKFLTFRVSVTDSHEIPDVDRCSDRVKQGCDRAIQCYTRPHTSRIYSITVEQIT